MPIKYSLKLYVPDGYYHVFNRGVNKMNIFRDKLDYNVFLTYLKTYILPQNKSTILAHLSNKRFTDKEKDYLKRLLSLKNYNTKIDLVSYCLMPNHYHLLIKQSEKNSLEGLMRSFMTRYTKYFNARHKRRGPLFEGRYKAIIIKTDEQLIYLSRYIHRNPIRLIGKQPSSYPVYLKKINQIWVKPQIILSNFSDQGPNSYKFFVEDSAIEEKSTILIYNQTIDHD